VSFWDGPQQLPFGKPLVVMMLLMYYPQVDYGKLRPGVTFTLREGPNIVGHGVVLDRWMGETHPGGN
jgi:hypothetical protein